MKEKLFRPRKIEEKVYKNWEASGAFSPKVNSKKPPYTILMPPPNVTGTLHLGHALTFTLQDILVRFHRMKGFDCLWQSGTDHAGIATQMVVERQLASEGFSRKDLGREKFLERVWAWKAESGGGIVRQLKALGTSACWERERFTMDEGFNEVVTKVFVKLHRDRIIYKGERLVNWDVKFQTAVSDLEVTQKDVKGKFYYIKYPLANGGGHLTVATTRPETMFGDTAVAVNPEDERFKHLIGESIILPIAERLIPIIGDEHSDPEKGTGVVKITPAHDFNDFEVGKRHNLPFLSILDEKGCLEGDVPETFKGLDRFEAREKVIHILEELGLLEKIEDKDHTVPFGDRSGEVIEPRLTEQWFLDASVLAKPALEAVKAGKTSFIPKQWEKTYYDWLENIEPWCISRQLWWGHQIPAWYGPDQTPFVAETEADAKAAVFDFYGEHVPLKQDEDVLDTWFSSALWPFVTLGWPEKTKEIEKYYPTSVLVTGHDIIFFWVARMMMMSLYFMDDVPFKDIYIHALVKDEKGQKMSKSKGNVIDPINLIEAYGADALRFTLALMASPGRDIRLSEEKVEHSRNFATKIWNATRFIHMNGGSFSQDFTTSSVKMPLNKWSLSRLSRVKDRLERAISSYKFNEAAQSLYTYMWSEYCDWYIELAKPILQQENEEKEETIQTLAFIMGNMCHLLHPLMPYITEEIWSELGGEGLLIESDWPQLNSGDDWAASDQEIEWVISIVSEIRSLRASLCVPASAKIEALLVVDNASSKGYVTHNKGLIERLARLSRISLKDQAVDSWVQAVVPGGVVSLNLREVIDIQKEKDRFRKTVQKLEKEVLALSAKLSAKNFTEKAPAHIVEDITLRLEKTKTDLEKSKEIFEKL